MVCFPRSLEYTELSGSQVKKLKKKKKKGSITRHRHAESQDQGGEDRKDLGQGGRNLTSRREKGEGGGLDRTFGWEKGKGGA